MHFAAIVIVSALGAVATGALLHAIAFAAVQSVAPAAHLDRALYLGTLLGILLAASARLGSFAKLRATFFLRPALRLLALVGFIAATAAMTGYLLVTGAGMPLWEPHFSNLPAGGDAAFFAALCSQFGAAGAALVGSAALAATAWRLRKRVASADASPDLQPP